MNVAIWRIFQVVFICTILWLHRDEIYMNQNRKILCLNICQCFMGKMAPLMIIKQISSVHNRDITGPKLFLNFSWICSFWFCKIQTEVTILQIVNGLNINMSIGRNLAKDFIGDLGSNIFVHNLPRKWINGP